MLRYCVESIDHVHVLQLIRSNETMYYWRKWGEPLSGTDWTVWEPNTTILIPEELL
jgi:hypothetical protein